MAPPVGGYYAWYDATQIAGVADGTVLTSWADSSGNGRNLTSSVGTPTFYKTTSAKLINGNPTVFFNRDGYLTAGAAFTPAQPVTIFAVAKRAVTNEEHDLFGQTSNRLIVFADSGSSGGVWHLTAGSPAAAGSANNTNLHVLTAQFNGSSSLLRDNGSQIIGPASVGTVGYTTPFVAGSSAATAATSWRGPIGELIVYPSALSTTDMASVESYLTTKWTTTPPTTGAAAVNVGPVTVTATSSISAGFPPHQAYCCTGANTVKVLDAVTGAPVATVTTAGPSETVAVSPDGTLAAVYGPAGLQFIATTSNSIGAAITTGLTGVAGLAWAPDSSKVYMQGVGQVSYASPASGLGPIWNIPGAQQLSQVAVSPDGAHLYCCCVDNIKQVSTATGAVTATYAGLYPTTYGLVVSPDGSKLYVSNGDTLVTPINVAAGTLGLAVAVATGVQELCLSPDGHTLYCALATTGTVAVIDVALWRQTATLAPLPNAYYLAVTSDGVLLWVSDINAGTVTPVNTYTNGVGSPVTVGLQGWEIGITPGSTGIVPPATGAGTAGLTVGPVTVRGGGPGLPPPAVTAPTIVGHAVLNLGPFTVSATDGTASRLGTARITIGPVKVVAVAGRVGPGGFRIPGYRNRWRLTLHNRAFAPATLTSTIIAELTDAYARRLDQVWNQPATLTFTLDGRGPAAALVQELLHDVVAWRWDDQTGQDFPVFRGVIAQAEDQITEQSHTVTYTCHDYSAVLARRLVTATYTATARDQDSIVGDLLGLASTASTSSGTALTPASFLPISLFTANPNGTLRGLSTQLRDRTYYGSQNIGTAIDDLSKIVNGFDYDVLPSAVDDHDNLRVFYPAQGVTRTGIALQYGSTVATVTRTVDSSAYANYVRVLGNNTNANPTPQLYAEDWVASAHAITPTPVGLWMLADDATSVTVQSALNDKATGDLSLDAVLIPHYTLGLAPDAYTWGNPRMGDTVPLIIQSGRLNVNTAVRVLGITYQIGDDGQEDVTLTVARPQPNFRKLLGQAARDVRDLALR